MMPTEVPVVRATVEDVKGSFAAFIERGVDSNPDIWRCGMCKIVLPGGFHIAGSAERAKEMVLGRADFKV